MLALSAAIGRFRTGSTADLAPSAAALVGAAAARLDPGSGPSTHAFQAEGRAVLARVLARLQRLLPAGTSLDLEATDLSLAMDPEVLERIATHLALHAIEGTRSARLALILEPVHLGRRMFGLLHVRQEAGKPHRVRTLFGLGWLRQSVMDAGGLLELDQDAQGGIRPRIYLPTATPAPAIDLERALEGRRVWVVDQDPLAREALLSLVQLGGGRGQAFEDLRSLLRSTRGVQQPDVLVLERTTQLERFHRSMRSFQKDPVPTLVMGLGHPLPLNPSSLGLSRLGFLEKPFRPEAFLEAVLALLSPPRGSDPGLL